jgi:hypothetical protein
VLPKRLWSVVATYSGSDGKMAQQFAVQGQSRHLQALHERFHFVKLKP